MPAADAFSSKFRIDGVLGAGGMGVVVVAQHLALDKRVAIKLMRPELRVRRDLVRRFLREARAAARLNSPHVAHVFDVGTLDEGAPYIVMEYLDGMDLAAWLRQHGPAPVPVAAALLSQVSDAIAEAHAIGIVHRDLKPANLFVTRDSDGESLVKVLDLGICRLVERTDELPDTSLATVLGTPAYMAPEQLARVRRADARSDIWSLGVILYELVTGRVPFHGHTAAELLACASRDPFPPMEGVTGDFEAIIARCLAKDPAARFQAVTELMAALAPFAQRARPVASAISLLAGGSRRRPRQWTLTAVIVAVCATAGASELRSSRRGDSAAQVEIPRPEGPPPQLARAPQQPEPALPRSTQTSALPGLAPRRDDVACAQVEPARAAPAAKRPRTAIPAARTAQAPHNAHVSVGSAAAPETTPPRASVDPLATPY